MKVSMYLGDVFSYHVVRQILHFMSIYVTGYRVPTETGKPRNDLRFSG